MKLIRLIRLISYMSRKHFFASLLHLLHCLPDLRFETHVQHAIGLIHDQPGDVAEPYLLPFHEVVETTSLLKRPFKDDKSLKIENEFK